MKQRLMCVQFPSDVEPADAETFEFSALRLRPPVSQNGNITWNTQACDGFEIAGLPPANQERVRLFFLSMRYDAGNLSADNLERVRPLFGALAFILPAAHVLSGQGAGA